MQPSGRPIYLRELVVTNFRTKFMGEDIRQWKAETASIGTAESCARQLWFGLQDDFSAFPARERVGIELYEGPEAYKFMLKLYCGLESERLCEDSIKGQICSGWDNFQTENPRTRKAIDTILQDIKADSRFINGTVLEKHRPQRHEIAARDLSGQEKGDKALLIGSLNRHGNLSTFTDGLARVIGNKRPNRVSEITVTHPDTKTLRAMYDFMVDLKKRGIIAADVNKVGWGEMCKAIEKSDRVYVDIPMDSMPEVEEHIILAWQTRIYEGNTLTHLRGDPNKMGMSTPLWEDAALHNYVSPEDIRTDMTARARNNADLVKKALSAIDYCAMLRQGGVAPSMAKVRAHVNENDATEAAPSLRIA